MKPLYEIANDYLFLINELAESDEITDEQMELLDQSRDNLQQKIINVGAFIRNLESEQDAIEKAIDDMAGRSIKLTKKIDKLKEYAKVTMENFNIKEVKSPYFDIKVCSNPPSVQIADESLLPKKFIKELILYKIDKKLLYKDLKNNEYIPGAILEQKSRLEIK
jgi:predicted nuclease with TOPRIM domain